MSSLLRTQSSTKSSHARWRIYVGSTERRRGAKAERDVAAYLREYGWDAITTRAASGFQHGDDIATNAPVSIEVKDHARLDLAGWVKQARANANGKPAVVWHKRRGSSSPGAWYVTMLGEDLVELLRTIKEKNDATCALGRDDQDGRGER